MDDLTIVRSIVAPATAKSNLSSSLRAFREDSRLTPKEVPREVRNGLELVTQDDEHGMGTDFPAPGLLIFSEARVLLDDLGSERAAFYAVPTDNNWVCYALSNQLGYKCVPALVDDVAWAYRFDRTAEVGRFAVYGLVGDQITSVFVEREGERFPARCENNAFYFEIEAKGLQPDDFPALILSYVDGSERSVDLRN